MTQIRENIKYINISYCLSWVTVYISKTSTLAKAKTNKVKALTNRPFVFKARLKSDTGKVLFRHRPALYIFSPLPSVTAPSATFYSRSRLLPRMVFPSPPRYRMATWAMYTVLYRVGQKTGATLFYGL